MSLRNILLTDRLVLPRIIEEGLNFRRIFTDCTRTLGFFYGVRTYIDKECNSFIFRRVKIVRELWSVSLCKYLYLSSESACKNVSNVYVSRREEQNCSFYAKTCRIYDRLKISCRSDERRVLIYSKFLSNAHRKILLFWQKNRPVPNITSLQVRVAIFSDRVPLRNYLS